MKQFEQAPVKRTVQDILFSQFSLKGVNVTGLAGESPNEYKKIIDFHFNPNLLQLVDTSVKSKDIINQCISEVKPTSVMDCDFCKSIASTGHILEKVYQNMNREIKSTKVLMFNFSVRMEGGYEKTISKLNDILYKHSLSVLNEQMIMNSHLQKKSFIHSINHTQDVFSKSMLIKYRDNVNVMLCGGIEWK